MLGSQVLCVKGLQHTRSLAFRPLESMLMAPLSPPLYFWLPGLGHLQNNWTLKQRRLCLCLARHVGCVEQSQVTSGPCFTSVAVIITCQKAAWGRERVSLASGLPTIAHHLGGVTTTVKSKENKCIAACLTPFCLSASFHLSYAIQNPDIGNGAAQKRLIFPRAYFVFHSPHKMFLRTNVFFFLMV